MNNYEKIARVFFDIEAVGKQAESGRITNAMLKRIERNRVVLDSMKNDEEMKPVVTRTLKAISLFRQFARAYNAGNAAEGEKLSGEMMRLLLECMAFANKKRGDSA